MTGQVSVMELDFNKLYWTEDLQSRLDEADLIIAADGESYGIFSILYTQLLVIQILVDQIHLFTNFLLLQLFTTMI